MQNILALFKNKFVLTAAGISVFILFLILIFSPQKNQGTSSPTPSSTSQLRSELEKKLPIYLESFNTSVGITTSINLYRLDTDEAEIVRLEIYGLSYLNADSSEKKNPNVTAFKESYRKALDLLESNNIDPKKLIFVYGDKEYVRTTSEAWIKALNLHP
jgi:hypothetical protein